MFKLKNYIFFNFLICVYNFFLTLKKSDIKIPVLEVKREILLKMQ